MHTPFRQRLRAGELLTGTLVSLACPPVAELIATLGFDWLFIDAEHGPLATSDIQSLLQAAQPHCPCLVRAPANAAVYVKQVLDTGADGIIAPLVNDAETAARVVAWAKYPPQGIRSVGIARAHGYGPAFGDYMARANDDVAVVVQVEHVDAVKNISAILDVAGIDGVFVGPYDLSASMGKAGRVGDPDVRAMIDAVRRACLDRGMPLGIFGADTAAVVPYIEDGFRLIAAGTDTLFIANGASALRERLGTALPSEGA